MCAEHLCSFCVIFIVTLSLGTLSLQDTKAQLTQVSSRARMWTFVLLAPNLCSFLRRSPPLVSSPLWATWPCWASVVPGLTHSLLHAITCRKASLPLTWLKFTVLVLLFFSNLLKSILVSQDFISNTDLSSFPPKLSSSMTPKVSPGPVARAYLLVFTFSSNWPVFQAGLCWSVPSPRPCVSLALCTHPAGPGAGFPFLDASPWLSPGSTCGRDGPHGGWSEHQAWGAHSSRRLSWRGHTEGAGTSSLGQTCIFLVQAHQFTNALALQQVIQHISPCFLIWHSR